MVSSLQHCDDRSRGLVFPEREWALLAREGDRDAFDRLAALYRPRLYSLAYGMVRNHDDAQDLTQEALLKAYTRLGTFREGSSFYTWLYRIAVNQCIDFQRKQRTQACASLEELAETGFGLEPQQEGTRVDPARALEAREAQARVRAAVGSLPETLRTVVELRDLQGLGQEETAEALDLHVAAVKTRLHRARGVLRIWLGPSVLGS